MNRLLQSTRATVFRTGKTHGFTLLEMMVALGILAVAYVSLMEAASGSMRLSTYGKQITIATFLAQSKMEEEEERLTREGFPDMDDTQEGNFEELGYPSFKWVLQVNKVELPIQEAFGQLVNRFTGGDEEGNKASSGAMGSMQDLQSMVGGQLGDKLKGQLGGMMGGAGGGSALSGMMNPDMLKGQVEMLANMLEQALREVQLTVYWEEGGPGKQLVLTTHLVQVPGSSSGAGAPAGPNAGMQAPGGMDPNNLKGFLPPAANKALGTHAPMGRGPGPHRGVTPLSPKLK